MLLAGLDASGDWTSHQKAAHASNERSQTHALDAGEESALRACLHDSQGGKEINTPNTLRFNATMRERLASLTRKCRHAAQRLSALSTGMYLIGCTYNFCFPHHELSTSKHFGHPCTPAMASGLTDHVWTLRELLLYQVAPAPWVESKRLGRPRKGAGAKASLPKRPRGRPRKHPLPDPTVPKRPRGRPRKIA